MKNKPLIYKKSSHELQYKSLVKRAQSQVSKYNSLNTDYITTS